MTSILNLRALATAGVVLCSIAPASVLVAGPGPAGGRTPAPLSDRTLTIAVSVDRDAAAVAGFTLKDRPYWDAPGPAGPRMDAAGRPIQVEVVLQGPAGGTYTRRIDTRRICLDHPADAAPHIEGDTIRVHRDIILVEMPEWPGYDRIEVAYDSMVKGVELRRVIGTGTLGSALFTPAGGTHRYDDLAFAQGASVEGGLRGQRAQNALSSGYGQASLTSEPEQTPATLMTPPMAAREQGTVSRGASTLTPGTVHWPEEYGDPDKFTVYGDASEIDRRINVVLVPDGYTHDQKALMQTHAQAMVTAFRAKTPYKEHDRFFNYILVYAYSTQSGTDQCDCSIVVDTAMNTRFPLITASCGSGDNRCLYYGTGNGGPSCDLNTSSTNIAAAELRAPADDTTIVMVNTTRYGGCGGYRAVYSAGNSSATEVAMHELGHSLGGLADEYAYSAGCGTYAGEINTSLNSVDGAWPEWVKEIGSPWQGAQYYQSCIYRPESNCEMRALGVPFCHVCNQQYALTIFAHPRIYLTAPISSVSPEGDVTMQAGLSANFSVGTRFASGTGVTNSIVWTLEGPGYPVPTTVATGTASYTGTFPAVGTYTLTCDVIADTNFIKPPKYWTNHVWNFWTVTVDPVPEVSGADAPQLTVRKNAANVDLRFSDTGSAHYNLYVSTRPFTAPFEVSSPIVGKKDCNPAGIVSAGTGEKQLTGYSLEAGISGPGRVLFFMVTADNGAGTEGSLGTDSTGAERSADAYCAR